MTTAPPLAGITSIESSRVASEPVGAGPAIGLSGVPAAVAGAAPAPADPEVPEVAEVADIGATGGWSGSDSKASFPFPAVPPAGAGAGAGSAAGAVVLAIFIPESAGWPAAALPSTGESWMRSFMPSAVTECSTSCRVAITRRVSGREPSSLFCTASEEISPSSGERSASFGPGTVLGSSTTTRPSALRKLVHTSGALASRSTKTSGAPSRRSSERISVVDWAALASALVLVVELCAASANGAGDASTRRAEITAHPAPTATAQTAADAIHRCQPVLRLLMTTSPMATRLPYGPLIPLPTTNLPNPWLKWGSGS